MKIYLSSRFRVQRFATWPEFVQAFKALWVTQ